MGTYFHGLFDHHEACDALLKWAGLEQPESCDYFTLRDNEIDRLADSMAVHLDIDAILRELSN
jgi:adenosylcobyric acid synthase